MSFNTLKKAQLLAVTQGFGIDGGEKPTVESLRAAIAEADYVEWDEAVEILKRENLWTEEDAAKEAEVKAEAVAEKAARPKDTVLKMLRANKSYQIMGYDFTQANPYALMTAEEAEAITDLEPEGFRYASPKEVAEFYG